jgi:hypothetical protein
MWSKPILVITVTTGLQTLVQSSRPPSPVSSTASCTLLFVEQHSLQQCGGFEEGGHAVSVVDLWRFQQVVRSCCTSQVSVWGRACDC